MEQQVPFGNDRKKGEGGTQIPFGNDRKKGEGETQGGTQIPSGMTKKELMLTDLEGFQI